MESLVLIMVTTGGRDDAERLGEALVVERLAASCTVVPSVHSIYFSGDQLKREHEALLLVRTTSSLAQAVHEYVQGHHGYEVPEILQVAVEAGTSTYLKWLTEQLAGPLADR